MVALELPANASLAEVLSARARRTPRDRLVLDVAGGLLVGAVAVWARPAGWLALASAAACFAFYGLWALAEVHLLPSTTPEAPSRESLWLAVQGFASVAGLFAFVVLLFATLGLALGRIIS